jgi:hypothetical protein
MMIDDGLNLISRRVQSKALHYMVQGALIILLVALVVWNAAEYTALMRVISTTALNTGHGPPVRWMLDATDQARALAEQGDLPIVVNATGDDLDTEGDAAAFDALLGDLDLRLISGETVLIGAPEGLVQVRTRADAHYDVEVIPPADTRGEPAARLANGVEFLRIEPAGLQAQIQPGTRVQFSAVWRVWGLPPTSDNYSYSVQLFDANWLRYANLNDHFLRTRYWREGDLVITSGVLDVPDDAPADAGYHVVLTLYTLDATGNVTPVAVVDTGFNKIGEFVDVPLD